MNARQPYDTLIIGAGMSGLAAGIRLAHFGKKVAILERHDRVGGLNSYYTLSGHDIDVGLHAVTNFAPRGGATSALSKIYRQLRIKPEDFDLHPQTKSRVAFPGISLEFTNEFGHLTEEVKKNFPGQIDNFLKLVDKVNETNPFNTAMGITSARTVVSSIITDPLLVEMIFCPLMYYGNPIEDDMDYRQFVIMFQSIFLEGFARPPKGVRQILDLLVKLFKEQGGELKLEQGVKEINSKNGKVEGVTLYDGTRLECKNLLSSIGRLETIALCSEAKPEGEEPEIGKLAFMESVNILDCPAKELGIEHSITFFSNNKKFNFNRPDEPVDVNDGVICTPDNFDYPEPTNFNMVRITNRADHRFWENIDPLKNIPAKKEWHAASIKGASEFMPDITKNISFVDIFSPRTVKRYTGHLHGAVYGAPVKVWDGTTPLPNLFLCGTDQGFLGIVGTLMSGISMANQHLLK